MTLRGAAMNRNEKTQSELFQERNEKMSSVKNSLYFNERNNRHNIIKKQYFLKVYTANLIAAIRKVSQQKKEITNMCLNFDKKKKKKVSFKIKTDLKTDAIYLFIFCFIIQHLYRWLILFENNKML